MRKPVRWVALAAALALPAAAPAAGYMEIHLELPELLPPMVVIEPGVQVIPEIQHEVFFVDGVYWARHGDRWYRSENPHAAWSGVPLDAVPAALVKIPPGKYKGWKPDKGEKHGQGKAKGHGKR